jgi:hypothetical protein
MLSFVTNELVWAMQREREEEIRQIRPHTAHKPDPERTSIRPDSDEDSLGLWIAPSLRGTAR